MSLPLLLVIYVVGVLVAAFLLDDFMDGRDPLGVGFAALAWPVLVLMAALYWTVVTPVRVARFLRKRWWP